MSRVRKESEALVHLVAVMAQLANAKLRVRLVLLCIPRQLLGQIFTFTTFDAPAGATRR